MVDYSLMLPPPTRRAGYTLVELLTVLTIALVMILLTTRMAGYLSTRRMESAIALVENTVLLAKETAILKRVPVMMVVPVKGDTAFQGMALYEQLPNGTEWKAMTGWRAFPPGVAFDGTGADSPFQKPATLPDGFPATLQLGARSVASSEVCGVLFDASGRSLHYPVLELRLQSDAGGGAPVNLRIPEMMQEVEVAGP